MTGNEFPFKAADNLVVKAYLMLQQDFDLPSIDIKLYKHIPSGAGLGGGSSDCAFMIKLLNRRFNLRMRESMMERYAARLGSDCAFFISNTPSIATGRGEILNPIGLSLKGYTILLVKPDVAVSTAEAYAGVTPHKPETSLADAVMRPVSEWRDCVFNDFEPSVFKKYPLLADIKQKLYNLGAEYAAMTGSGSTVYGIFSEPLDRPSELFPDMFVCQREFV
jgi:4-diphosphocytidyl-2-C-methyl-D-erythritol kinase